jgi:hypothetical protein
MSNQSLVLKKFWILVSLVVLSALTLTAQGFYGTIVGEVTDQSGSSVPGAIVTLLNNGTGAKSTVQSATDGSYRFVNLTPGEYKVDVGQTGFKHYSRDKVTVEVDSVVRIDPALEVGDVEQTVEVTSAAPLLQTENASLSQIVGARMVEELPLNGRNVLNLVGLTPGVVMMASTDGSPTGKNVFSAGNYQLGGGTENQSATYFDGVPLNVTYGNLTAFSPTQDAVAEFRVQTSNNTAEYGRYTGGVVNIASKAGTNAFHGTVYEFLRNKVLNAANFFDNANGQPKGPFVQNQFGLNSGGPAKKDKIFFFASYEGYRSRTGVAFNRSVPTLGELAGDFTGYVSAAGAQIPIYDPSTQCGVSGNAPCSAAQLANTQPQRTQFTGNKIPASRISPIAKNYIAFPYWGLPNVPGQQFGNVLNFYKIPATGGDNNQLNFRGDINVSDKQRVFGRFTRLQSRNQQVDIAGNGLFSGDPYSPEVVVTDHAVLVDTYVFSASKVLDVRAGFMRWWNDRVPGTLGIDIPAKLGFPAYYSQIPVIDGIQNIQEIPAINISSPTRQSGNPGPIRGRDDTILLAPSFTWLKGRHAIKFGAEWQNRALNYYQNNTSGGTFSFDNLFTSQNALNSGATGSGFASFLLGLPSSGTVQISPFTYTTLHYQGYYVTDTWRLTGKLTVTLGLRWEIPGVYIERFDRQVTFNPTELNPITKGITIGGKSLLGAFDLVNTANHPERGLHPEAYGLVAPRLGLAYRLNDKTVIRTGGGKFFLQTNATFMPVLNPASYFVNSMVATIDKNVTPVNTLSDPYPGGLQQFPGRNPNYEAQLTGASLNGGFQVGPTLENEAWGYTYQWNFTVQRQLPGNIAFEAGYAGLRGMHLPFSTGTNGQQLNQLNPIFFSLGSQLNQQVANPFYGVIKVGALSGPTVARGQLLLPFPQYQGVQDVGANIGDSTYHSMQLKGERRFSSGGVFLATYTFSKQIGMVGSQPSLTGNEGSIASIQNIYNLNGEKGLGSFDARHRMTFSYVYDLPFGKGKRFGANVTGIADKLISGWGVNGNALFQAGFPLALTATPNTTGFNTGLRPNVAAGCQKEIGGSAQSRLGQWFNTSCFSLPTAFTFGSESRTDPNLRGPGAANYDLALFKRTKVGERTTVEFRVESFNLFNRVRFGAPNTVFTTAASSTFGQITTVANSPRLLQMGLRLSF